MSHIKTDFTPFLTRDPDAHDTYRIIKGTENMVRYPKHNFKNPTMGLIEFGTQVVNGVSCLKVAKEDVDRLKGIGWRVQKIAAHYAYILPPLPEDAS